MFIETSDSTRLAVDVWGTGRPVVLVHAWGLSSHMWNAQLPAFLDAGLQVVTFDHRGHGRSDRPAGGYDLDSMAADVITVLDALDLRDVAVVGLSAPITPCLTLGDDNELGLPAEAFAANRAAMAADIGGWLAANSDGYWGVGEDRWPHDTEWTLRSIYETPLPVLLATNEAITSADLRQEIAGIDVPILIVQGDADLSAPVEITGRPTAAVAAKARLEV